MNVITNVCHKGDNRWVAAHAHDEDEDEAVDNEDEDVADYDEDTAHVDEDEVDEQKEVETISRRVQRSSGPYVSKRRKKRSESIGHITVLILLRLAWLCSFTHACL